MSDRDDSYRPMDAVEASASDASGPAPEPIAGEALRHLRPTSAFELFDRAFLLWRLARGKYSLLGLLATLPGMAVELYALWRWPTGGAPAAAEIVPWAFLGFVLQLLPLILAARLAFSQLMAKDKLLASRMEFRPLHMTYPRVVVSVLFIVLAMAIMVNWGLAVLEVVGPGMLSLVVLVGAVAASLWVGANLCLAPLLVALGWPRIFHAFQTSWKLMVFSRFSRSRWRDNAYWRLALLMSFPLACQAGVAVFIRLAQWVETGSFLVNAASSYIAAHILLAAGLDVLLMPWTVIALVALLVETMCRFNAFDIHIRLRGATGVDSIVGSK